MPVSAVTVDEAAARRVLLLRAFESGAADDALWTADDAAWATRLARETVPAGTAPARYLDQRAQHALQRLVPRDAATARLLRRRGWRRWWPLLALLAGAGLGVAGDAFGGGQHISVLAPTVWALVAWNLAVYASLLLPRPRRLPAWLARRLSGGAARLPARQRFQQAWAVQAAPLLQARAALLLHALAAALALGLIAGLYLRGLVLDYRAGWQSTFLDAGAVHAVLATALAPAAVVTGIAVPDAASLAALRIGPDDRATASAAPWLHLYAAMLALFVLLPRGLLAAAAGLRAAWRSHRMPLALDEPYFQRLLWQQQGRTARVQLLAFGETPSPHLQALVRTLLEQAAFGSGLQLTAAPAIVYGSEEAAGAAGAASAAGAAGAAGNAGNAANAANAANPANAGAAPGEAGTTLRVLAVDLGATPEDDSHGAAVRVLRAGGLPLLLLADEAGFRRRFAALPERLQQRRHSWQQWAAAQGVPLLSVDLAQPDLDRARSELQAALR